MADLANFFASHIPDYKNLLLIIFLFSLGKSMMFVSPFLPPASVTLLLGIVVGKSIMPMLPIWFTVMLGATLGSVLSFHCGSRFQNPSAVQRLPAKYHAPLAKAKSRLEKHGLLLLFSCRFIAVLRYIVPFVAGAIALPRKQVYLAALLSASIWSGVLLVVSHLFPPI
ncbi:membrane protein DedA with SNARE-associated domain [Serratia fonticola]|uniref:Membrane protein DedA with SNARE-associated domain n=1 Tax=Serratia fonticola TaxID=47917 RepID=A0A559TAV2_SERFO|nr:VTT domain-containing protein [Serratia fonticola]TQI80772.1 membrane protein DedA with SNARE-associated domain [Serratia fonticola]TQI97203.1 membrane protein DedA with SNARE-associated domain [Serratia fonticola]TVZ71699.1 membrane protein DedA with SNARE-associated domain [Serratia fonticola]